MLFWNPMNMWKCGVVWFFGADSTVLHIDSEILKNPETCEIHFGDEISERFRGGNQSWVASSWCFFRVPVDVFEMFQPQFFCTQGVCWRETVNLQPASPWEVWFMSISQGSSWWWSHPPWKKKMSRISWISGLFTGIFETTTTNHYHKRSNVFSKITCV